MFNDSYLYPFPHPNYVNVPRHNCSRQLTNWIHPFAPVHVTKANAEEGEGRRNGNAGRNRATNSTNAKTAFTKEEAAAIALLLGIDFNKTKFDLDEFLMGVNTELEHGRKYYPTNVTEDDPITTGKIALAHLNEFPDYYFRLKKLEEEAKVYWN